MRETERERMLKRMRLRERWRERRTDRTRDRHLRRRREENLIKRMAFVDLNPLGLALYGLANSSRVSMDSRCREFLIFADYGVKEAVELVKSLEEFSACMESKWMKGVEAVIREAALKLEDVLDSHVSDQFLSQSGDERLPLVFSLNLEGIEQDIDGFVEKMMDMDKLLNPWSEESSGGGEWSDILGLSDPSPRTWFMSWSAYNAASISLGMQEESHQFEINVTRTWFISWFATKAASIFLGMKEDYIQELEKLLPPEEEDDDYAYAYLFISGFSRSNLVSSSKIKDELTIWWIGKAASVFGKEEEQLDNPLPEDDDDISSRIGHDLNMVGLTDLFCKIRDDLMVGAFGMVSIVGMAGIGKTALANKILQDPSVSSEFECCIFVRIGQKFKPEKIMQAILAQLPQEDQMRMVGQGDLHEYLHEILKVKKYLLVLDDVWDRQFWDTLFKRVYPYWDIKSRILVTTRINQVARHIEGGDIHQVPFLNKEESWDLLRGKIFGEKGCPRELEKVGKTIAENCEGLPLLILTVADILSKAEKTLEHWSHVAANKTNSTFVDAYERILEVLYPSYSDLPQRLKTCFLYLGAFPQNDQVRVSKLLSLWSADGFLGVSYPILQGYINGLLVEIVSNNVALGTQWSSLGGSLKICSLHSVFWYFCKKEAWNAKFLLVLNSYRDATTEDIEITRRLSIYKNIILSIKDVRDSIASMSTLRALLCTGPYHQYQVPIFFALRLLRLLDALTIRFYEFPMEVFELLHLKYLALTCNENLPPSISKLWNLRSLILHPHQSIKSSVSQSYLPVEIWYLHELEYLQIMGRNLPDPPPGAVLRKLLILLDVGADTCTELVLGSIPNLEKLRVQIELMPSVAAKPLSFCDDISHLRGLVSLQFVVVNPALMLETFASAPLVSTSYIRKLTLSGLGYPWEEMKEIAKLPHLEVLKLKCHAFRGENWQVQEGEFKRLDYILIEDTDLVQWTGVLHLWYLTIKHCYRLQEIPQLSLYTKEIRVVDCNPSAVTCAQQMAPEKCRVYVDSSWLDDDKLS